MNAVMARHTLLHEKANKQGEMPLHILSPIPSLIVARLVCGCHLLPQSTICPCGLTEFYSYVSNDKLQANTLSTLTAFAIPGIDTLYMLSGFLSYFFMVGEGWYFRNINIISPKCFRCARE